MKYKCLVMITCIFLLSFVSTTAQEWYESRVIILETWADFPDADLLDTLINENTPQGFRTKQERIEKAFIDSRKMAKQIYGDIIFGYEFEYMPGNKKTGVIERWKFTPVGVIPYEDPNMIDINRDVFNNQLTVVYRYNLTAQQFEWAGRWERADIVAGQAHGYVSSQGIQQVEGNQLALKKAYQEAIKDSMQKLYANKPLRIKGFMRLDEAPYLYKSGAFYNAKVKISIKIDVIKEESY